MSNHSISLQKAIEMTTLYRDQKENILKPEFQQTGILAIAETFSRDAFDTLLSEAGCESLRIYYGMNEDLSIHAIIVAVNADGEDILPPEIVTASNSETVQSVPPIIVEEGIKCPPHCGVTSLLNPHP